MLEERTQHRLLGSDFLQRLTNGSGQMPHIIWNKVGQFGVFGPVPRLLIGVKFRCICGKPFDGNSSFKALCQSPSRTTVHHPAIPDKNNSLGKVFQQGSNKRLGLIGGDVMIEQFEIKFHVSAYRRNGNSRDNRDPISAIPTVLNRGLATRRPCASDNRLKHKAAFIQQNNGFTAFSGFFLYVANRSFARGLSPVRLVRGLCVRAFGNSIPSVPTHARCQRHRMMRQSVFGLPQLPDAVSKGCWYSRAFRGFATEAFSDAATGWRSVWMDGRCVVLISGRPDHTADMLFSTVRPQPALRQNAWPLSSLTIPVPATPWPKADVAPYFCMTLYSSYKIISEKSSCLSELFKGQ